MMENEDKVQLQLPEKPSLLRSGDAMFAAFLAPVIIMLVIFAQRGIFPVGDESFLRTDMYHQYAPFFSEFRHKLAGGGSLLYSWDVGMGVNFAALYAYYLASPLNWLLIVCPRGLVIEFMTYSIVLKTGLAGLSFAWYLRKHCNTSDFGVAFFGIFYALSGYMAAYSWNIMWLDCILLFPMVMLGLEKLVREKKGMMYCITLGCCILSNYYISIMICIFMVIYFLGLLILAEHEKKADYAVNIVQFAFYSILAGGLAAVILLPEIYALQMTASGDFTFPKTFTSYFSIFDMISRHIPNIESEIGLEHWPNIYCGVAVYILFPLYLACKKIKVREKAVYTAMLLFFVASFSINILNFVWHGFHYPNSLPCRQSFIYIFLVLFVCYQAYRNLWEIPWRNITLAFAGSAAFVILAEKLVTQEHFHFAVYYGALIYLALYAGLMYLYKCKNTGKNLLVALTLGLICVEAALNMAVTSVTTTSRQAYVKDNEDVRTLVESIPKDSGFYRIEKVTRKTKNDGAWMNFPSVSLFSSTANAKLSSFFKTIGCESSTNAYSITGSTPLVDSLLSVKYALSSDLVDNTDASMCINEAGDTWLYENKYTLPLGFAVSHDLFDNWQRTFANPADVQNDLSDVLGITPVLISKEGSTDGSSFTFTAETTGRYYLYVENKKVEKATLSHGEYTQTFSNVNRGYFLDAGIVPAGEEVTLSGEDSAVPMDADAYLFDEGALKEIYNALSENPWTITIWRDDCVEGTVTLSEDKLLFTSIPYDKGWKVYVDGAEKTSEEVLDAFVSVKLSPGTHTVRMEYEPEGLRLGAVISIVSIGMLLIAFGIGRHMTKRAGQKKAAVLEKEKEETGEETEE